jgi:hypothetical protein
LRRPPPAASHSGAYLHPPKRDLRVAYSVGHMCKTFPPNKREVCLVARASIKVVSENRLRCTEPLIRFLSIAVSSLLGGSNVTSLHGSLAAATSRKQTFASSRRRRIPPWLVKPNTEAKTVQNCSHRAGCGLYRLPAPSSQFRVVARVTAAKRHNALRPIPSHLKWAVHSSEQPSDAERDCYCRIGLIFDGMAQRLLKGTAGLGGAVDG